jgi:hypothetical protein
MSMNITRVSFAINSMDFLVDGGRRYLPFENGYFIHDYYNFPNARSSWQVDFEERYAF